MKYEEFKTKLMEELQKWYGNEVKVSIESVLKHNGWSYEGLKIVKTADEKVTPMIPLDLVYEKFNRENMELQQCVEQVCQLRELEEYNFDMNEFIHKLTKWEEIKEQIYPVLVATEKNETLLKSLSVTQFLDLSVIYRICGESDHNGQYSVKINKSMLKELGVSLEQLHKQAMENQKREGYQFATIESILKELFSDVETVLGRTEDRKYPEMIILSNRSKCYGAAGVLNKELLREYADGRSFFIILSCVHEAILIPDAGEVDTEWLNHMIEEAFEETVDEEEQLSKHFYYYNGAIGEVTLDK